MTLAAHPCPRCGALAGVVVLLQLPAARGRHQAMCRRIDGGCDLRLPIVATAAEAEAAWQCRAVEAAVHRERIARRRARFTWVRDPVLITDVCEHYVGYGTELGLKYPTRVMWAAYDTDPRRLMNVQAFVYVYLAPRYGFVPTPTDEARVHRVLHQSGFPITTLPVKRFTGAHVGGYRSKQAIILGLEPYDVT